MGLDIRTIASYISLIAEAAALGKLLYSKLVSKFPCFSLFLALNILVQAVVAVIRISPNSDLYRRIWECSELPLLLLQVAVALELYRRLSRHYENFGNIAGQLMRGSIAVAAALCALSITIDLHALAWTYPLMGSIVFAKRCTTFILAAFLFCIALFFARFSLAFRRNVVNHARIFSAYLIANSAGYLALDLGVSTYTVGVLLMIADSACFVSWAALLSAAGEKFVHPVPAPQAEIDETLARRDRLLQTLRNS